MRLSFSFAVAAITLVSACETLPNGTYQPLLTPTSMPANSVPGARMIEGAAAQAALQPTAAPQRRPAAETAYIKAQLNALQGRSIAENREYCGYLGIDTFGDYAISSPVRGGEASCRPNDPPASFRTIASYHTHAAYAPAYDGEVPSSTDLAGDVSEGINGYVSTPGGRLWFTDGAARQAVMICGLNCLISDPRFRSDPTRPVASQYSLAGLRAR